MDRLKSKKSTLSKNMTNVMKNAYAKALYYADESNTIDDGIDNINRIRKLLAMAQVEFDSNTDVVKTKTKTTIEDDIKSNLNNLNTTPKERSQFFKSKKYFSSDELNLNQLISEKSTLSKNMTDDTKNAYAKALYYADESNKMGNGIDNINRIRKFLAMAQVEFEPKI